MSMEIISQYVATTIDTVSITSLVAVAICNIISTCLGTLKSVLSDNGHNKPVYFIVFLDSIIFIFSIAYVTKSTNAIFVTVFALSRLMGVLVGNMIDDKVAMGIVQVTVYKHFSEESMQLADTLRELGYTVTTYKGFGMNGKERMDINIVVERKEYKKLMDILRQDKTKLNMYVNKLDRIEGKVGKVVPF